MGTYREQCSRQPGRRKSRRWAKIQYARLVRRRGKEELDNAPKKLGYRGYVT